MASRDDERLRIKPGAPKRPDGSQSGQRTQRFVSQVLKQVSKAGAKASGARGAHLASTFGRGRVAAGLAGSRLGADARRVVIKSRYVVLKKAGAHSVSTHLRYIERDGVTRDGERGQAYPKDRMLALQKQAQQAQAAAPVDSGLSLQQIRFRYAITGDSPPWKPLRAFDDGERVYIQFPAGIAQGELPPLFVIGQQGDGQLVNYRFRSPYYVVDRLFGAAELRLGTDKAAVVRIERTDGVGSTARRH